MNIPISHQGFHKKNHSYPRGAIFLYVLFCVTIFMLLFSSLVYMINSNLDFVTRAFVRSNLAFDSSSTAEKTIALFQLNRSSSDLLNNSQKRDVVVQAYTTSTTGYVYSGKSDSWTLREQDYTPEQSSNIPDQINVDNQSSTEDLSVTIRTLNPSNRTNPNYIESEQTQALPTGSGSVVANVKSQLAQGKYVQIILSSNAENGAPYGLSAGAAEQTLPLTSLQVQTISYENIKSLPEGENVQTSITTNLEDPSYNLFSQSDFASGNSTLLDNTYVSSMNQPGLGTAYVDTFNTDLHSTDWAPTGSPTYDSGTGTVQIPSGGRYVLNRNINGDFDLRVRFQAHAVGTNPSGMFVSVSGLTYYAAVQRVNIKRTNNAFPPPPPPACTKPDTDGAGYVFYEASSPYSDVRAIDDNTDECKNLSPYSSFTEGGNFILRIVRTNDKLDGYYCNSSIGDDCDTVTGASLNWNLINPVTPLSVPTSVAAVGIFNDDTSPLRVDYFRIAKITSQTGNPSDFASPAVYEKTVDFGQNVTVTKIEVNGFIPSQTEFNNLCTARGFSNCTDTNVYELNIFDPATPGSPIVGPKKDLIFDPGITAKSSIKLQIKLKSLTGDISQIPFIRSVRVFYQPS